MSGDAGEGKGEGAGEGESEGEGGARAGSWEVAVGVGEGWAQWGCDLGKVACEPQRSDLTGTSVPLATQRCM